jgi:hypothetical protein
MNRDTHLPYPENYVSLILDRQIRVDNVTPHLANHLRALGGHTMTVGGETVWILESADDQVLGELVGRLRDLGVLFVGVDFGGWPPADVFRDLRDKGLVQGEFQEVLWHRPGSWFIRTG